MKFDNDILISRRSAVAAALLGCSSLILPTRANALGVESYALDSAPRLVYPDLNDEQVDELVHLKAEAEANRIISQAQASANNGIRASSRPTYSTVYGSVVTKSTGWHDIAGQPSGGIQIKSGGAIYVQPSGGGSVSVSVSLPGGVGSISVSIAKAKRSLTATGYLVNISGSGYYKARANLTYKIQPYVVYEKKDGVRKVYAKNATREFYSIALGKRQVK